MGIWPENVHQLPDDLSLALHHAAAMIFHLYETREPFIAEKPFEDVGKV